MTKFEAYTERFRWLAAAAATEVSPVTLYFVSRGRNAWNSKWVEHYSNGCMHASLHEAKTKAETMRTCGSVFEIEEQPAVLIRSLRGVVAITEIDARTPLRRCAFLLAKAPLLGSEVRLKRDQPDAVGALIEGCRAALRLRQAVVWKNDLVVLKHSDTDIFLQPLRRRNLRRWKSSSCGTNYRLQWEESIGVLNSGPAHQLSQRLGANCKDFSKRVAGYIAPSGAALSVR